MVIVLTFIACFGGSLGCVEVVNSSRFQTYTECELAARYLGEKALDDFAAVGEFPTLEYVCTLQHEL